MLRRAHDVDQIDHRLTAMALWHKFPPERGRLFATPFQEILRRRG